MSPHVQDYDDAWDGLALVAPEDDDFQPPWETVVDDRLNALEEHRLADLLESPLSPWYIANTVGLWVLAALVAALLLVGVLG